VTPGDWIAAAGFVLTLLGIIFAAGRIIGAMSDLADDVRSLEVRVARIESWVMARANGKA